MMQVWSSFYVVVDIRQGTEVALKYVTSDVKVHAVYSIPQQTNVTVLHPKNITWII